jgi:hypothetical protein
MISLTFSTHLHNLIHIILYTHSITLHIYPSIHFNYTYIPFTHLLLHSSFTILYHLGCNYKVYHLISRSSYTQLTLWATIASRNAQRAPWAVVGVPTINHRFSHCWHSSSSSVSASLIELTQLYSTHTSFSSAFGRTSITSRSTNITTIRWL